MHFSKLNDVMPSSRALDHVGIFARSIADVALLLSVLAVVDNRDPDCYGTLVPNSSNHMLTKRNRPPKLALILGPQWFQIEAEAVVGIVQ